MNILEKLIGSKPKFTSVSKSLTREYGGLTDLLIYFGFVNEYTIFTTHGSFITGFEFRGYDLDSSLDSELNKIVLSLNNCLKDLSEGWSLHIDVIRSQAKGYISEDECFFPDSTSTLIDLERRILYNLEDAHFENRSIINFCWLVPGDATQKIESLLFENNKGKIDGILDAELSFENLVNQYNETLKYVFSTLVNSFPFIEILKASDYVSYLNECITGESQKVLLPGNDCFLQTILGNKDLVVENYPKIGNKFIKAISVYALPGTVSPGLMHALNSLKVEFRFNTRFIYVEREKAKKEIRKIVDKYKIKSKTVFARILEGLNINSEGGKNDYALLQAEDAKSNLSILESETATYGFYTNTFILINEDLKKIEAQAKIIYGTLKQLGFTAQVEDINSVDAYFGSLPGYTFENVVQLPIFTHQLCCMLPITGIWSGETVNPNPLFLEHGGNNPPLAKTKTIGGTPFNYNIHVKDVGHTLVVGSSGSGKSTLLQFTSAQFLRYRRAKVFVFDSGYSFLTLCHALNGKHIELISQDFQKEDLFTQVQPLSDIDKINDFAWACSWLANIYELNTNLKPNLNITKSISEILKQLALDHPYNRTMSALTTVHDPELRDIFKLYTNSEPTGKIFDGNSDSIKLSNFTVFELKSLFNTKNPRIIVPLLEYIFYKIEKEFTGSPTLVVIDELWSYIEHSFIANKLVDWLKTKRKNNVAIICATQSIEDIIKSDISSTLIEETKTKIILPNASARDESQINGYRSLGLNDNQLNIISLMEEKKQYYMIANRDKRIFELGLDQTHTPAAMAFFTKNSEENVKLSYEFYKNYGKDFAYHWLKHFNLEKEANALANLKARLGN